MFRPCWVIFRENSLVTLLDALIQLSENAPLLSSSVERCPPLKVSTSQRRTILPEDDPAGSKHVGGFYE
jgi:hypothetical protein